MDTKGRIGKLRNPSSGATGKSRIAIRLQRSRSVVTLPALERLLSGQLNPGGNGLSVVADHVNAPAPKKQSRGSWIIGITGFVFILLQSACTAVITISGLRLLIGIGSLAAASVPGLIIAIHTDKIRIPMMAIAVLGSLLNLYVVWRIRSLRARPSSQWRTKPVSARQRRSEVIQIAISIATLVLVVAESLAHHALHGSFWK